MKSMIRSLLFFVGVGIFIISCDTGVLDKQPLDQLVTENFWNNEEDVNLALAGLYSKSTAWSSAGYIAHIDMFTDNGIGSAIDQIHTGNLNSTYSRVTSYWNSSYRQIAACNYFLENIEPFEMDGSKKTKMIAEARFLRAFAYYNMSQLWGGVPLVTKILSMDEANSVTSSTKETIVNFVLAELNDIIPDLPITRPPIEHGRIIKGAALATKGRLLMSEKDWSGAAVAYREIMNLGVHTIDPDYRELFNGKKEQSSEIIYSRKYLENEVTHDVERSNRPNIAGGYHSLSTFQNLVDAYLCIDGKSINESDLYDPHNPVVKDGVYYRDPRLLCNTWYPEISIIQGKTYHTHPDSTSSGDEFTKNPTRTGYGVRKYVNEEYTGDLGASGSDIPIIRYAEVLLSYLECKIKGNDVITQELLDETINRIRKREAVNMPEVTETDLTKLWEILKRERRVELAWEGLRYWDLIRWGEVEKVLNGPFYGVKLTDDPENYDAWEVGPTGHRYVIDLIFRDSDLPWPFPQDELDINPNLEQKDNWK